MGTDPSHPAVSPISRRPFFYFYLFLLRPDVNRNVTKSKDLFGNRRPIFAIQLAGDGLALLVSSPILKTWHKVFNLARRKAQSA
jgi:hypothetical protein